MTQALDIKICGLSNAESIDAAIRGGATHIGMIFFEKSPRHVTLEQARTLSEHAANMVQKVAVTVNATDEELDQIVRHMAPDIIQLHGREDPARGAEIAKRYNLGIIRAVGVNSKKDIKQLRDWRKLASRMLFDAKAPKGAKLPGGNGQPFDWTILKDSKHLQNHDGFDRPYMLSGGLDTDNIAEALEVSGALAVDVSSGVESAPGQKDLEKIQKFLAALANCPASKAATIS